MTTPSPDMEEQAQFWQFYDIIDGWYHQITRHHLVEVDPDARNMIDAVVKSSQSTTNTAVAAALDRVEKEVITEQLEYEKYGECPSCGAKYMYQCTCATGHMHTLIKQRQALDALRKELIK